MKKLWYFRQPNINSYSGRVLNSWYIAILCIVVDPCLQTYLISARWMVNHKSSVDCLWVNRKVRHAGSDNFAQENHLASSCARSFHSAWQLGYASIVCVRYLTRVRRANKILLHIIFRSFIRHIWCKYKISSQFLFISK